MLTEDELWQRVRQLEGQTVYTLVRQSPNPISRVTENMVEIQGRITTVNREDLWCVYWGLHQRGQITADDLYGEKSIVDHPLAKKTGRIMMAILATAVPEEIDIIRRRGLDRLSGIRRRETPR